MLDRWRIGILAGPRPRLVGARIRTQPFFCLIQCCQHTLGLLHT